MNISCKAKKTRKAFQAYQRQKPSRYLKAILQQDQFSDILEYLLWLEWGFVCFPKASNQ